MATWSTANDSGPTKLFYEAVKPEWVQILRQRLKEAQLHPSQVFRANSVLLYFHPAVFLFFLIKGKLGSTKTKCFAFSKQEHSNESNIDFNLFVYSLLLVIRVGARRFLSKEYPIRNMQGEFISCFKIRNALFMGSLIIHFGFIT